MAKYRKLSRTSDQRKALLRSQVTSLLYHGKIVTTEAKAKEIRKIAEGLVAMAVREKDNFETVTVTAKVARKDAEGKRVKEVVDGKKKTVYDEVQKEIKKDAPSRLHARRQMMKVFYPVKEVPAKGAGRKKNTKDVDMVAKMFDEIAPKYADRNGGYTRIVKIGPRKGDACNGSTDRISIIQPDFRFYICPDDDKTAYVWCSCRIYAVFLLCYRKSLPCNITVYYP